MRKVLLTLLLAGLAVGMTGCAGYVVAPVVPPPGFVWNNSKAPMDVDMNASKLGKQGQASSYSVLGLVAWGDCSAQTAAKKANIETINHADWKIMNVLGVYSEFTTVVYGE